jgi:hypothetical protein
LIPPFRLRNSLQSAVIVLYLRRSVFHIEIEPRGTGQAAMTQEAETAEAVLRW